MTSLLSQRYKALYYCPLNLLINPSHRLIGHPRCLLPFSSHSSDLIFKTEQGVKTIVKSVETTVTVTLAKCLVALENVFEVIHPLSNLLKITFWGRLLGTFSSYTPISTTPAPLSYQALAGGQGRTVKMSEKLRVLGDVQRVLWMIGKLMLPPSGGVAITHMHIVRR